VLHVRSFGKKENGKQEGRLYVVTITATDSCDNPTDAFHQIRIGKNSLSESMCQDFAVHSHFNVNFAPGVMIDGGSVGVSPGTSITGTEAITLVNGATTSNTDSKDFASSMLLSHAAAIAHRGPDSTDLATEIGGMTFGPGTYRSASAITLAAGSLVTLDGRNQASPEFLFQADNTLTTGANTEVILINGAKAENVLWAVGASATIGANSVFEGSIIAGSAITLAVASEVHGCVLATSAVNFAVGTSVYLPKPSPASDVPNVCQQPSTSPQPTAAPFSSSVCRNFAVQAGAALTFADTTIHSGDVCAVAAPSGAYNLLEGIAVGASDCDSGSLDDLLKEMMTVKGTPVRAAIGGKTTFTPGAYYSATAISIAASTTITLDGFNQKNPSFLFQSDAALTTGASINFILLNGAKSEKILWAVGAAATIGASSVFEGSILAGAAITLEAQSEVRGCVLAKAAVLFGAGCSVNATLMP
jgi:hypothetical protein